MVPLRVLVMLDRIFTSTVEISGGGGSTWQPQCTEPCQCLSDQPWAYHGALQAQMQALQCAAGVVESALLRQGWADGLWGVRFCRFVEIFRGGGSTGKQQQRIEPYECVSGQPWACHGAQQCQMKPLQCAASVYWGLHWGLRQSWAGGLWGLRFCRCVEISRGGGSTR